MSGFYTFLELTLQNRSRVVRVPAFSFRDCINRAEHEHQCTGHFELSHFLSEDFSAFCWLLQHIVTHGVL